MSPSVRQLLMRAFFLIVVFTLVIADARPNHFADNSQVTSDQDSANSMYDSELRPWQVEMLIQRLAEINNQPSWRDHSINEVKRQSRFRQCYFNPISCFKK